MHELVSVKPAVIVMFDTVSAAPPMFESVTELAVLALPTRSFLKLNEVGLTLPIADVAVGVAVAVVIDVAVAVGVAVAVALAVGVAVAVAVSVAEAVAVAVFVAVGVGVGVGPDGPGWIATRIAFQAGLLPPPIPEQPTDPVAPAVPWGMSELMKATSLS